MALFAAYAVVYVVWGSTYLGLRLGVRDMPPGLLAGARFFAAGLIMIFAARLMGQSIPVDRVSWRHATIIGFALVVVATLLGWWLLDERLSVIQSAGLVVIVTGMLMVNRPANR